MKSKSLILMIVSLGFGLIAAVGISQVMGKNNSSEPALKTAPVLVATDHLKTHTILTEENVKVVKWPITIIPEGAATSLEEIQNKAIGGRLSKDMPIMIGDLVNKSDIGGLTIPPGKIAVAIKVAADDTLSGLLRPGDKVNVIGVFRIRQDGRNVVTSSTILKNVEVYAVDGGTKNIGAREGGAKSSAVVAVLVSPRQAEILTLVQKEAHLKLALRGNADDDESVVDGEKLVAQVFGSLDKKKDVENGEEGDEDGDRKQGSLGGYLKGMVGNMKQPERMRVWSGFSPETFTFGVNGEVPVSDRAPAVPPSNPEDRPDERDAEGYDDNTRSDENDRGLEQDQYPGE